MPYSQLSSVLLHDVTNDSASPSIPDMFTLLSQVHKYGRTRSSSAGNFYWKYSRLNHRKNSFASVGVKFWNSIPENLKRLSKHTFKKQIQYTIY